MSGNKKLLEVLEMLAKSATETPISKADEVAEYVIPKAVKKEFEEQAVLDAIKLNKKKAEPLNISPEGLKRIQTERELWEKMAKDWTPSEEGVVAKAPKGRPKGSRAFEALRPKLLEKPVTSGTEEVIEIPKESLNKDLLNTLKGMSREEAAKIIGTMNESSAEDLSKALSINPVKTGHSIPEIMTEGKPKVNIVPERTKSPVKAKSAPEPTTVAPVEEVSDKDLLDSLKGMSESDLQTALNDLDEEGQAQVRELIGRPKPTPSPSILRQKK